MHLINLLCILLYTVVVQYWVHGDWGIAIQLVKCRSQGIHCACALVATTKRGGEHA